MRQPQTCQTRLRMTASKFPNQSCGNDPFTSAGVLMAPGHQQDSSEICDRPIQPRRGFGRAIDVKIRANENGNDAGIFKISAIEAIDIDDSATGAEMNDLCV
jgi:hypothetical protein